MKKIKDELTIIPGIGVSLAQDLHNIGTHKVPDLIGENPEELYDRSNKFVGSIQDPCVLYAFRCAVYFASNKKHHPELLKWWNWKIR